MTLLLIICIIALALLGLLFFVTLKVFFTFNSDEADMNLTLLWLYPFIKVVVANQDTALVLTVYLFKKSILRKNLKSTGKGKSSSMDLAKQVKPKEVNVHTAYGFTNPFYTGVACGALSIASQFINIDSIEQFPDFVAEKDYIYVDATAEVNVGSTLVNLYRARREK